MKKTQTYQESKEKINSRLDLENPIFVIYLDVKNLTSEAAEKKIHSVGEFMYFENVTTWFIRSNEDKVELIWQGSKYSSNPGIIDSKNMTKLVERVNDIIEMFSEGREDEVIKKHLRNIKLKDLTD